jgi:uncharacterized protein YjhX (UPF0386 family)
MNVSRSEQRVLHVLALGGSILHDRNEGPKVTSITCVTREGSVLSDCTMSAFIRLRKKRLIESRSCSPYRISQRGRLSARAQLNNQGA